MSQRMNMSIQILSDVCIVWICFYFAYLIDYRFVLDLDLEVLAFIPLLASFIGICVMTGYKLYNRIWRYASIREYITLTKAILFNVAATFLVSWFIFGSMQPVSFFVHWVEAMLLITAGSRLMPRLLYGHKEHKNNRSRRALIVGAGDCGNLIVRELLQSSGTQMNPVAFVDDDWLKHQLQLHGIPVVGGSEQIPEIVRKLAITDILISIPSATKEDISRIVDICKMTKARLKIMPLLNDLIEGKVGMNQIRDVEVEDLLGREPVKVDMHGIASYVTQKTVLVTGAGGSIGSELCRQISSFRPFQLLLLGHGENSIYTIEMELRTKFPDLKMETIIADIQDRSRIMQVFQQYRPQVVFHAAAHKHVPLMEANPSEAIKNNILGTKNVAECAERFETERFVLISSDKAVNPTSVMGATKRAAEMIIQGLSATSKSTIFTAVRFGNVLGSRGSVIPRFKEQIRCGGPVTVTHPDMVRYFMTIPEAVQLVIQAGALAGGGEVFVLDMGQPVRIVDLARDLIRLSGFEPDLDIQIHFTGIRPGEKLYEELLTQEEGISSTKHDRIFIGKPTIVDRKILNEQIRKLEKVIGKDSDVLCQSLNVIVSTYMVPFNNSTQPANTGHAEEKVLAGA